ncbi:MAG TPA: FHA domain-containing protein [Streptosporangiaceae bacterium]|nr:FHA domain-containing protein [Streptosporangiaceae bacterium]
MTDPGSEGTHPPGLWPVPGDGVLARYGNLILLSSLDDGQFVDGLLDALEQIATAGGDGRQFADEVAAAVESTATGAEQESSVLAFGAAGTGLAVTVSGGAWADVITAYGTQRIEAGQPGMLVRCLVRSAVTGVRGGLGAADNGPPRTDRFSRLDAGTVRAGGLSFFAGGIPIASVPPPARRVQQAERQPAGPEPAAQEPAQSDAATMEHEGPEPEPVMPQPAVPELAVPEPAVPELAVPELAVPEPAVPEPVAPAPAPAPPQDVVPSLPAVQRAGVVDEQEHIGTELWQSPSASGGAPPVSSEPFEAVVFGQAGDSDAGSRVPLSKARDIPPGTSSYIAEAPIIQGVYCKNGHFDDPEALFCAVCGISMNQQTLVPRPGTRPPLGVLLLDDGSVFQLDRNYIVGREPGLDASVASGRSRALRINDDSGIVSRVHAKIALDGWHVLVTDLGSANGTRVRLAKQPTETQLQPHVPLVLTTGSQIDLGGRGFRYESHRGR